MHTTFPSSHTRDKNIQVGCPYCYQDEDHVLRCTKHHGKRCDPAEIPFELCNFYFSNNKTIQSEVDEEVVESLIGRQ